MADFRTETRKHDARNSLRSDDRPSSRLIRRGILAYINHLGWLEFGGALQPSDQI